MNLFLKDFSILTELKFSFEKCLPQVLCNLCNSFSKCNKCKSCSVFEEAKKSVIDYKHALSEYCDTFRSLSRHENKNIAIYFDCQ